MCLGYSCSAEGSYIMIKSLISAFLMYSRIPMPQIGWKEENRRYALGFFPLVGAVIGGMLILWRCLCDILGFGQFLFAVIGILIPILITGGIHADGFCDVTDARASYADRQKRLEIMSDPHIGSFAVIRICLYFLLQTALMSQIQTIRQTILIAFGFVISRSLSALSAVTFRCAKKDGSLQSFVKPSHRTVTICMVSILAILSYFGMLICSYPAGIIAAAASVFVFLYYRYIAYRDFGGITGDLCGWFLQLCEIWMLAAAVFSFRILEVLL